MRGEAVMPKGNSLIDYVTGVSHPVASPFAAPATPSAYVDVSVLLAADDLSRGARDATARHRPRVPGRHRGRSA